MEGISVLGRQGSEEEGLSMRMGEDMPAVVRGHGDPAVEVADPASAVHAQMSDGAIEDMMDSSEKAVVHMQRGNAIVWTKDLVGLHVYSCICTYAYLYSCLL